MAHFNTFAIEHVQINNNLVDTFYLNFANGPQIIRSINIASDDTVNGLQYVLFKCDDNIGTNSFKMFENNSNTPTTIINNVYNHITSYNSFQNFILDTPFIGLETVAAAGTKTKLIINYQTFEPTSPLITDTLYQTLYFPSQAANVPTVLLTGTAGVAYLVKSIFVTNNTNSTQDGIFSVTFGGGSSPWGELYTTNTLGPLTKELVGNNQILISPTMSLIMTPSTDNNYNTILTYTVLK